MRIAEPQRTPARIIPVIVISQFAGTSLWFAGNAVLADLQRDWGLPAESLGQMTSAVQLGFIAGTLLFAAFALADRYSPRLFFFLCSLLGAFFNLLVYLVADSFPSLLIFRFLTGLCLAGIYPVGMKIAAGWFRHGLGNAIGFLVGALVLGTAFPHLLRGIGRELRWEFVTIAVSVLAVLGGILMFALVPDGPYLSKGTAFNPRALSTIFRSKRFRSAAFAYFGHMWELYTFWAFVPWLLAAYSVSANAPLNIPFWSFWIIGAGSVGCIVGGILSRKVGSARIAFAQLLASGACCILSPFFFHSPLEIFVSFLVFWGVVVVGDSPQFSALVARSASPELVGSALTIMNSIGFAITIVSIQVTGWMSSRIRPDSLLMILAIGPILGLMSLRPLLRSVEVTPAAAVGSQETASCPPL